MRVNGGFHEPCRLNERRNHRRQSTNGGRPVFRQTGVATFERVRHPRLRRRRLVMVLRYARQRFVRMDRIHRVLKLIPDFQLNVRQAGLSVLEFDPMSGVRVSGGYRFLSRGDMNGVFGLVRMSLDTRIERMNIRLLLEFVFPEFR